MKLMIAGGGTGGHLFPGIATARAWRDRIPSGEVFFVGTARGLESKVVPAAGFRLLLVEQVGLKNRGLVAALRAVLMLPKSLWQSLRIVQSERPQVALGVGGYAAGPAMLAAWLWHVPALILEPNAMPGLTNRILGALVLRVVSPYDRAGAHFSAKKLVRQGIPVRSELAQSLLKVTTPASHSLLIFGGSQGAHAINEAALEAVPALAKEGIRVVHQTGRQDLDRVRSAYAALPAEARGRVEVREFIDDMAAAYANCDLVVCRAGASTLAELAIVGRASILVPLPTAADDHQTKNAQDFAAAGAALLLPQKELSGEALLSAVKGLMANQGQRRAMADAAKQRGDPRAAEKLCDLCLQLAQSRLE